MITKVLYSQRQNFETIPHVSVMENVLAEATKSLLVAKTHSKKTAMVCDIRNT